MIVLAAYDLKKKIEFAIKNYGKMIILNFRLSILLLPPFLESQNLSNRDCRRSTVFG